jgi:hypothetical protein
MDLSVDTSILEKHTVSIFCEDGDSMFLQDAGISIFRAEDGESMCL